MKKRKKKIIKKINKFVIIIFNFLIIHKIINIFQFNKKYNLKRII